MKDKIKKILKIILTILFLYGAYQIGEAVTNYRMDHSGIPWSYR